MSRKPESDHARAARLLDFHRRLRACRICHARGFIDEAESEPVVLDLPPNRPVPRILLVGQAPSLRGTREQRPFAGLAGEKLRDWFERAGIPRVEVDWRIHFAAITRCYPGRLPGARGDRVPSPEEQALCRPWHDELLGIIQPRIVLAVGLLAIRAMMGAVPSLTAVVGHGIERDGVRYLGLPHPSGVSRWLNEPANQEAVERAIGVLRGWVAEME